MQPYACSPALTLNDVHRSLIPALTARGDYSTAAKLAQCRHGPKPSWCRINRFCTLCSRTARKEKYQLAHQQIEQLMQDHPGSTPLFASFTTEDCELWELRQRVKDTSRGWKALFQPDGRKTPLLGRKVLLAAGGIEAVPSGVDADLFNVHLHTVLLMRDGYPGTGRDRIRQDRGSSHWMDLWSAAVGSQARSAHVELPDNLDAVLSYSFKASFAVIDDHGIVRQPAFIDPFTKQLLPADRILTTQDATAGVARCVSYDAALKGTF